MKRMILCLLALTLLLTGCGSAVSSSEDLMKEVKPAREEITPAQKVEPMYTDIGGEGAVWEDAQVADFAVRLLQATMEEGKNTLISPMSVLSALAMTANGAEGNTLAQMEAVLGQSVNALNSWYHDGVAEDDVLHLANGIWFRDDASLAVKEEFLQKNADFYGAGIYKAPFDETTLTDINTFVEENTNGMVKDILDKIPEEAVMYLVNALAFEAQWQEIYKENQVHSNTFMTENSIRQDVELMWSEESFYYEHDLATGFRKPYRNGDYAFVALLPKEGVSVKELVEGLDGKQLQSFLANPQNTTVDTAIPKFEVEYDAEMSRILQAMGMTDAFDSSLADFSGLGTAADGNIYLSRVIHKTFISVAEKGTKAGAATVVEAAEECAAEMEEIKEVILNRPFLYMIVDTNSNTPIFMGTLMNMEGEEFLFVEPNENGHVHLSAEEPNTLLFPVEPNWGDIPTVVRIDGAEYTVTGEESVELTALLINQDYNPDAICRCMPEFTVDTKFMEGFEVNLTESFVRCERGQTTLTAEQIQTIRQIINRL